MANDKRNIAWTGKISSHDRTPLPGRVEIIVRGELVDIYRRHIPAFRGLPRDKVYDMVLNSPTLAAACHDLFRERPDLFRDLLVGPDGRPIKDPDAPLACGKSQQEITAMIVRAVARRHFLQVFRPNVVTAPTPEKPNLVARITQQISRLVRKPIAAPSPRRKATRGDSLYRAMREHLLYHWQLRLIPHYTPLPVTLVRQLGERILDYRSVSALQTLLSDGLPADPPAAAPPETGLPPLPAKASPAGAAPKPADSKSQAMLSLAWSLGLKELFAVNDEELRNMVDHASVASGAVIARLSAQGLRMSSVVVLLCTFERRLGGAKMPALFGPQAALEFLDTLAAQIDQYAIAQLSHAEEIKDRVEIVIRKLQRSEILLP